jgi:hypothetical protein
MTKPVQASRLPGNYSPFLRQCVAAMLQVLDPRSARASARASAHASVHNQQAYQERTRGRQWVDTAAARHARLLTPPPHFPATNLTAGIWAGPAVGEVGGRAGEPP